jgi:hypothetical protein
MNNRLVMAFVVSHFSFFSFNASGALTDPAISASDTDFLANLAHKYAPQLRQHEREPYPLANVEWFIKNAGLSLNENGREKILIPPGQVTLEKLAAMNIQINGRQEPVLRTAKNQRDNNALRLFIPKDKYHSIAHSKNAAPVCYAYPRYIDNGDAIDITYFFFFPYNGTARSNVTFIEPILEGLGIGHHEGDFEHVTVRIDKTGAFIKGMYFAAHGASEGKWHLARGHGATDKRGYKIENSRPLVFTALETHGSHNHAGTIFREPPGAFKDIVKFFGILVEETSNRGNHYDCRTMLEVFSPDNPSKNHPWLLFRGRFGGKAPKPQADDYGPESPLFSDYWFKQP